MSSGADCLVIELNPGVWCYKLQRWPYGETPDYDRYGPFASEAAAIKHLGEHHQNPGGWTTIPFKLENLRFRCVWRGPSYDPSEKIVGFDHFSDDLGYGADDRAALLKLLPKKIFAMSPDHEVERIK